MKKFSKKLKERKKVEIEIEKDEEREVKKEKGEERDVFLEEIAFSGNLPTFEALLKVIPKLDKGIRIKVFSSEGKFVPLTKTGNELAAGYKMVGFSFIPVVIVEKPLEREVEALSEKKKEVYRDLERAWAGLAEQQAIAFAPWPIPRGRAPEGRLTATLPNMNVNLRPRTMAEMMMDAGTTARQQRAAMDTWGPPLPPINEEREEDL